MPTYGQDAYNDLFRQADERKMTATVPPAQRPSTPVAGHDPLPTEDDAVDLLHSIVGGGIEKDIILYVLRKHGGNTDKAANALLEGERGEPTVYRSEDARQAGSASALFRIVYDLTSYLYMSSGQHGCYEQHPYYRYSETARHYRPHA